MKTMKIIVASIAALGILLGFAACAWAEQYPTTFLVEALDYATDTVTFSDMNGQQWLWEGIEDWSIDDMAAAIMDDNGTPIIYDDSIVMVYYQTNIANWFEPDEVWED